MSDNQPIYIMPEGTQRSTGRDAQRNNILAAKLVAETVRTTLGPKGMDKMIVSSLGDVIITNDGVTILNEMNIVHPGARMVVEVAKAQEEEVGDGTTTAVVLAGELLKNAEALLDKHIHPTIITKGYQLAANRALTLLSNLSVPIDISQKDILLKIVSTAMTGKGAEQYKEKLSQLVVEAVLKTADADGNVDPKDIRLEKKVGEGVDSTSLIQGILLDKEKVHINMPEKVDDAKILLLNFSLEPRSTETDAKIQISDPSQMQAFLDQEEKMMKEMINKIKETNANVIFSQKGIDDYVQHLLAKNNIYACRRVKKSDMEHLSKSTGARILSTFEDISQEDLGFASQVYQERLGDEKFTHIKDCKYSSVMTLLIRGGTEHVVDEVKRALNDAIRDVSVALKDKFVVGGAGSIEIELSSGLRSFSQTLSGREQLAVEAFANALEVIPRTLAENAGLDPIDIIAELKSLHELNNKWAGINVYTGKAMDAFKEGVIEPTKVKSQAIRSASELAVMILRIDDVIAGRQDNSEKEV